MSEFKAWPKIPRLHRDMIITEKIDGTNACIFIEDVSERSCLTATQENWDDDQKLNPAPCAIKEHDGRQYAIYAQSRKRLITPGKSNDNAGFARWVADNSAQLVHLGEGRHYGEWWGKGIQRGYGLEDKHFSLFNVGRDSYRAAVEGGVLPDNVHLVPTLETYTFDHNRILTVLNQIRDSGSIAAAELGSPDQPAEGIIVYHTAAQLPFKVTLEGDESPKGIYKGMHSERAPEAAV